MNEIIRLDNLNAVEIYSGGLDVILDKIRKEALKEVGDISTDIGRKIIASRAYKIAKTKTCLDDMGKKLGEEAKKKLDLINADRKKARESLDLLKSEVRQPLTDYENKEKARVANIEKKIEEIRLKGDNVLEVWISLNLSEIKEIQADIKDLFSNEDFQEFSTISDHIFKQSNQKVIEALAFREKHDEEQIELELLREASKQQQIKENEQAKINREKEIKEEAVKEERKRAQAMAEAKQQKENARCEQEKARLAQKEQEAVAKRLDLSHRNALEQDIVSKFVKLGIDQKQAELLVKAISENKILTLKILY